MIRYRIDDRVILEPPSERHPAFARIASIDGRSGNLFNYGGSSSTRTPSARSSPVTRRSATTGYSRQPTAPPSRLWPTLRWMWAS